MSSKSPTTNGYTNDVTVSVKELKSKFNGPPLGPPPAVPKSPTRKASPKSPISVTTPTRKTEFALGKFNIHIQDKGASQNEYKVTNAVTSAVTTAKPGSKISELAKNYPHPHPVPTPQQQTINQQMYTRSNSRTEGKRLSNTENGAVMAPSTKFTTPPRVKTPTTPVTISAWDDDKRNGVEIQESVRERITRLNSREEVAVPIKAPPVDKPHTKISAAEPPTKSQLVHDNNLEEEEDDMGEEVRNQYGVENGAAEADYNDDDGEVGSPKYDDEEDEHSQNGDDDNDEHAQRWGHEADEVDEEPEDDDQDPDLEPEEVNYNQEDQEQEERDYGGGDHQDSDQENDMYDRAEQADDRDASPESDDEDN